MATLTPDERADIVAAIVAGGSCRSIAREFGRSPDTVSKIAKAEGITDAFDRSRTAKATKAKQADNRERRAHLATVLLVDAERLRARLWEITEYVSVTKDGNVVRYTMETATASDARNLMTAAGIALDKSIALERVDGAGSSEGEGLLTALLAGIGAISDG